MAKADDMITRLAGMTTAAQAESFLATLPVRLLREIADLQGVDSVDMTKHNAIGSIIAEMSYRPAWSDTQTNAGLAGTVPPEFACQ
jgi:hypothetical protein